MTKTQTWTAMVAVAVLCGAARASAQGVGSGPLTSTLTDTEPQTGALSWGPVKVSPGLIIREAGWDSNVFDEAENPKQEYMITALPDVAVFSRLRYIQLSAYGGLEIARFKHFPSENSLGHSARGRVDFLFSRVLPFIGGGETVTRTRANGEIDVRAKRVEDELSGGLAYSTGAHSVVYASATQFKTDFENTVNRGVSLETALDRTGVEYSGGLRTALTPITTFTGSFGYREDRFRYDPSRNAISRHITGSLKAGAEASFSGTINAAFENFQPASPDVRRFNGLTGSVAIAIPIAEVGRIGVLSRRAVEYSFNTQEAYFIDNLVSLSWTERLLGAIDAQVVGARSWFQYNYSERLPKRTDRLEIYTGGFGYNLKNRTRVSINYEYSRRRSLALAERNYDRRRAFLAWTYAF